MKKGSHYLGDLLHWRESFVHIEFNACTYYGRFSDFRSSHEVTAKDPLVTETLPRGDGERELFGPAPKIPLSFHGDPRTSSIPSEVAAGNPEPDNATSSLALDEEASSAIRGQKGGDPLIPLSAFRWRMKTLRDGGCAHSMMVSGSGILLSPRGWSLWRLWSNSRSDNLPSKERQQQSNVSEEGHYDAGDRARSRGASETESGETAASGLAFAFDVQLSGTYLSLEPWEYESEGLGLQQEAGGFDQEGSAIVVCTDLAMRMTTAVFLEGHWAKGLGAEGFPHM